MAIYSIKDIENLSGIKAHTIRIWEKRYNLLDPKRTDSNIRYYDDEDLKKLLNVALLNRKGHRISQIACLDNEEIYEKIQNIHDKHRDNETRIDDLIISTIELDERKFENVLSTAIEQSGFENVMLATIFPLFEKIGILWQTGVINPAQEHFISNLVRQKIIVAIDGLTDKSVLNSKHFLLFLPENEMHELSLLFKYYLLKRRGFKVTYLGQSVPCNDLLKVLDVLNPDYLLTSFYSLLSVEEMKLFQQSLSNKFDGKIIFYSTAVPENSFNEEKENFIFIKDNIEFSKILDKV